MMCRLFLAGMMMFVATASELRGQIIDEAALKRQYDDFVKSLNYEALVQSYPKAIQDLRSQKVADQLAGIRVIGAIQDPVVIPWIAPLLDSSNASVRIWAGLALERVVSKHELKRRDMSRPDTIIIRDVGPNDVDLKPVAWVVHQMLSKRDDANVQAYAATMAGYLKLTDFAPTLTQLKSKPHPAVQRAAENALKMMGAVPDEPKADVPEGLSEQDWSKAEDTLRDFGALFLAGNDDKLGVLMLPFEITDDVFSDQVINDDANFVYRQMTLSAIERFLEYRRTFSDLSKFTVQTPVLGQKSESRRYRQGIHVMKNAYVELGNGNRLVIRIKIEDMVWWRGRWYITSID